MARREPTPEARGTVCRPSAMTYELVKKLQN